ncbi:DNA repair protein RadA [Candidatus Peregrinibacteria bacterium]|nr:DNA repair protein RadA [Candidatus Peregrinibacteria bacterium]
MKLKTIYICSQCGAESPKWGGQCLGCGSWNSLVEDVVNIGKKDKIISSVAVKPTITIRHTSKKNQRLFTQIVEFDRVVGGGFMSDSVVLLAGDPGIGKSTLTLQICDCMAGIGQKVLYFSGEESVDQITDRANRLGAKNPISVLNLNSLESILATIQSEKPGFVVVDSVQVMVSEELASQAGSISQVRYVTEQLMQVAKSQNIPILLIGHVNKEGNLAGPQVLTHLVDTVLFLEGDRFHQFRLLRTTKNRFGAVDEVGVFAMKERGLIEVKNPSALFLEGRAENPIGSVIVLVLEGTRTFLVEVQALTSYTHFGYPKRTASGVDMNRLNIVLAVLERYAKIKLDNTDVFVNVVGGLRLSEPAVDLAIAMAVASSKLKKPLPPDLAVMGEIGLSGEVRNVTQMEKRLKEAEKLGFKQILSAKQVRSVEEAVKMYFN